MENAAVILRSLKPDNNHNPVLGMGRRLGGSGQGGGMQGPAHMDRAGLWGHWLPEIGLQEECAGTCHCLV